MIGFALILSLTGGLRVFNLAKQVNEPEMKMNSMVFVSQWVPFDTGDYISFNYEDDFFGKEQRIFRLVGKENDIVEIKNGVVYLNGENYDKHLKLAHKYILETSPAEI